MEKVYDVIVVGGGHAGCEAAVAAARTRNFALSSGILALLAAAIGLIVVSARRGPGAFDVLDVGTPYSYHGVRTGPTCKRPMRGKLRGGALELA